MFPRATSARWRPDPVARPEDVNWGYPLVRTYLVNLLDDPAGPFAFVDARSRSLLKNFVHHRNPKTGEITPGCDRLAYELPFKQRTVRYTLGKLDTGPSRQRDGMLVDGHGLIWRKPRWRRYGGQTSNLYGFTCKFLVLAGLVLPHELESCPECRGEPQAPKGARPQRPRRGRAPRPVTASLSLPKVPMQSTPTTSAPVEDPLADPDFETFAVVFTAERAAKYGNHDAGTVRPEKGAVIGSYVQGLIGEACAWAQSRGLEPERAAVREDLCRRIVRIWLTWTGTDNFLLTRPDPHPMGLIVGDLLRVGPEALAAWKRAQPRPRHVPLSPPPSTEQHEGNAENEAEAWPELDTSESTADEVTTAIGELAGVTSVEEGSTVAPNRATRAQAEAREGSMALALTGDARFDRAAALTRERAPGAFDQWFVGVQFDGLAEGVLSLRVQNGFVRDWVRANFLPGLLADLVGERGPRVEVSWVIAQHLASPLVRRSSVPPALVDATRVPESADELVPIEARGEGEAEPTPRRGRVRTRIALRTRQVGAAAPEADGVILDAPTEAQGTVDRPRRRHLRSRSGLLYELAGPKVGEPPLDGADDGDGEKGDGES